MRGVVIMLHTSDRYSVYHLQIGLSTVDHLDPSLPIMISCARSVWETDPSSMQIIIQLRQHGLDHTDQ